MFKHQIRVPYRDVTVGNHIYYARYLDILEVVRNEFFRELGHPLLQLQERGVIFPVVECHLRYHAAARYDDLLDIETRVTHLGRVQLALGYEIRRGDTLLVAANTRLAATTLEERPARMPPELYQALEKHAEPVAHGKETGGGS